MIINRFDSGIIVLFFLLVSCQSKNNDSYRELGSEVFESSFEDIFELLLDSVPLRGTSFFLDTISMESDLRHLSQMEKVLEYIPDRWPMFLVGDMVSDFDLNQTSISVESLNIDREIIVNPKAVKRDSPLHFGTIRLSKFFYTPEKHKVIFFMIVYCGNQCSEAGIVYVRKTKKGEWRLDSVLEVWGSG